MACTRAPTSTGATLRRATTPWGTTWRHPPRHQALPLSGGYGSGNTPTPYHQQGGGAPSVHQGSAPSPGSNHHTPQHGALAPYQPHQPTWSTVSQNPPSQEVFGQPPTTHTPNPMAGESATQRNFGLLIQKIHSEKETKEHDGELSKGKGARKGKGKGNGGRGGGGKRRGGQSGAQPSNRVAARAAAGKDTRGKAEGKGNSGRGGDGRRRGGQSGAQLIEQTRHGPQNHRN
jgi:hypothetical protein